MLIATAAMLIGPTAALAQQVGPTENQYDTTTEQIEAAVGGGSGASPAAEPTAERDRVVSALPFTGFDLGLLATAAVLLGLSGFALQRLTGTPSAKR